MLVQRKWDGTFFVLFIWLDIFVTFWSHLGERCLFHQVMDQCKVAKHVPFEILSEKLCSESYYALVHFPSLLPGH